MARTNDELNAPRAGSATAGPAPRRLTAVMAAQTQGLHRQAEKSGIIADILRGRVEAQGYALLLRNLLPAYRTMERAIMRLRDRPALRAFARKEIFRGNAIEQDLTEIVGEDWPERLSLLDAGADYATCVEQAATGDGSPLIAHAYVRYFGDLSGGQTIKSVLKNTLGLADKALTFYAFAGVDDPSGLRERIRAVVDGDAAVMHDHGQIVEEAAAAFQCNIRLSNQVRDFLSTDV